MAVKLGSNSSALDFGPIPKSFHNLTTFTIAAVIRPPMTVASLDLFVNIVNSSANGVRLGGVFSPAKIICIVKDNAGDAFSKYVTAVMDQTIENRIVITADVTGKIMRHWVNSAAPVANSSFNNGSPTGTGTPDDNIYIGARPGSSSGVSDGGVSEVAFWTGILPDSVCGQISAGKMSPAFFRDLGGLFYSRVDGVHEAVDEWGGRHGAPTGTVTNALHPQVIYPIPKRRRFFVPASGGGGNAAAALVGL